FFPLQSQQCPRRKEKPPTLPVRNIKHRKLPRSQRGGGERNVVDQAGFYKRLQPQTSTSKHPAGWRIVALRECASRTAPRLPATEGAGLPQHGPLSLRDNWPRK